MNLSRRQFLVTSAIAGTAAMGLDLNPAQAAEPPQRNGKPFMKLSLAAYSFNRLLPRNGVAKDVEGAMTLEDVIDYAADLNLDAVELTGYYFPKTITPEYLASLKERTFRLGLDISGTAIGNDFCVPEGERRNAQLASCRQWIDYAAAIGAPVIRIFAGNVPSGDTETAALDRCISAINEMLGYAAQKGVFLALENHGGITATPEQMLSIVRRVDPSPWFGVNFDSGNFRTDDPYRDLEKIAPYAINAQIKVAIAPNGKKQEADLPRIIRILKDANYRGYVVLEYEEGGDVRAAIPPYIEKLRELTQT